MLIPLMFARPLAFPLSISLSLLLYPHISEVDRNGQPIIEYHVSDDGEDED